MTGYAFALFILERYNFRRNSTRTILSGCRFELWDETSAAGGGEFHAEVSPPTVIFHTSQHEAAVHEMMHAWLHLAGNHLVPDLISAFLINSDLYTANDEYNEIRGLCNVYRYGDQNGKTQWLGYPYYRWNEHEIFAGLGSCSMGKLNMFPNHMRETYNKTSLREIYANVFMENVFLPIITG